MDLLVSVLEWFLIESIYGAVIFSSLVAGASALIMSRLKGKVGERLKLSVPAALAVLTFLGFVFLAPSYERVKFEKKTLAAINANAALRIVSTTNWGALSEPYTLFTDCCIGHFDVVTPDPITDGNFSSKPTAFRRIIARYDEQVQVFIHVVSCQERTYEWSSPSADGVFQIQESDAKLSDDDFELYCVSDWRPEMVALRGQTSVSEPEVK